MKAENVEVVVELGKATDVTEGPSFRWVYRRRPQPSPLHDSAGFLRLSGGISCDSRVALCQQTLHRCEPLAVSNYLIKKDVHFCFAGTKVVFLDLEQNNYSGIDREQATALKGVVAGWEAHELNTGAITDGMFGEQTRSVVAEALFERGLLTESEKDGKKAIPTRAGRPTADLLAEYESSAPSVRILHVIRFVKSYVYAVNSLRELSLAEIANRIDTHKRSIAPQATCGDVAEVRRLVRIYIHLRPFFFRASDQCLLDSLVLVEFLRCYNIFPNWVIGVSTDPFRAHSWLEVNQLVINDQVHHVNKYVPIMAR